MADTINASGSMDVSLKENGVIVDMTPVALLKHSVSHHNLRSHKDISPERPLSADAVTTATTKATATSAVTQTNLSTTTTTTSTSTLMGTATPTGSGSGTATSNTFRCERCDNFETNSRASLLLHVVQCLSSPVRLKAEEPDPENLSVNTRNSSGCISGEPNSNANTAAISVSLGKMPTEATNLSATSMGNGNTASSPAASSASSTASSTSRKVFECDVCNMKFSNGANMRRHKMRHTGVKPYECRVCQKRFFRKDHLAEHFTTHTKTLPYHCPICNRGFQRQIAMRAHFQNEHVGQHDLVKTCPLCSYRAGSMKSLRIHFFNRHGIDLDNPGPGGTSTLLLALESQASQVAAAAAAAGFVPGLSAAVTAAAAANTAAASAAAVAAAAALPSHQSDSGESMRSMENATPPMHFLTPHVEISTLPENGAELFNGHHHHPVLASGISGADLHNDSTAKALRHSTDRDRDRDRDRENGSMDTTSPALDHHLPMDCNTKTLPSSTSSVIAATTTAHMNTTTSKSHHHHENHITPSISLIPIKQEPMGEDLTTDASKKNHAKSEHMNGSTGSENSESEYSSSNNRLTSLIKVSPLKSLLREDLKRRICAKANNRITRNAAMLENNNVIHNTSNATSNNNNNNNTNNNNNNNNNNNSSNCNSTPICNGTITSTGQDAEASSLNRKQILTCLFCGIEFPDETLYFLHKGCHCESNPWKCNICGEQCNNVYEFNAHLLSKSHQ